MEETKIFHVGVKVSFQAVPDSERDASIELGLCWVFRAGKSPSLTWSEQDDGHGDEGADHQDDQQSDGDAFPVPLRWTHPAQVLRTEHRSGQTPVETSPVTLAS